MVNVTSGDMVIPCLRFFLKKTVTQSKQLLSGESGQGIFLGFPDGTSGKEPAQKCRRYKRCQFDLWVRSMPWKRA